MNIKSSLDIRTEIILLHLRWGRSAVAFSCCQNNRMRLLWRGIGVLRCHNSAPGQCGYVFWQTLGLSLTLSVFFHFPFLFPFFFFFFFVLFCFVLVWFFTVLSRPQNVLFREYSSEHNLDIRPVVRPHPSPQS